jgi:uncharacterized membrane protein
LALAGAAAYSAVGAVAATLLPGLAFFRPAAAVLVFAALTGGPLVGCLTGLLGDLLLGVWQGGVWLHWSIGMGLAGGVIGLLWLWSDLDTSPALTRTDFAKISFFTAAGFFLGSFLPAVLDIALGAAVSLAFLVWALPAWVANALWGIVLGTLLLLFRKGAAIRRAERRSRAGRPLLRRD